MRIIIILILLLVFFALGFLAGIFVLLKRQAKRLQAMRDSLKEAVVIPTAPPPPSLEADRIQKVKSLRGRTCFGFSHGPGDVF
jgi:flagellar basal body-associated protein FliL